LIIWLDVSGLNGQNLVYQNNMNKKFKKLSLILLIGIILISFGLGSLFGKSQVVCQVCPPEDVNFSLFWEAWKILEERFVEPQKIDTQVMIYGAISGMVESLGDPYTIFLNPERSKVFSEDISGKFEGVGMEIGIRERELQVVAPLEGTPAQRAGLRAGDKIMKIDGEPSLDITIEEAVSLIRGPKGTEVILTIFREDWDEARDIEIERAVIEIPSLKWELKEGDIAYIRLYHFTQIADYEFNKAAMEILNSPAKRIVLDLRNNPGGYLEVAQDIAGWFLENGQIVAIEDFGEGEKEYKAEGLGRFSDYPIVCLINKGTASGSEILAGALRDNRGVIIIGERSFGKGSVQELVRLRDGSNLKITIAKWLTPKRESIADIGLEPDIEIEMSEEDYLEGKDPQLEKAIEIVKGL